MTLIQGIVRGAHKKMPEYSYSARRPSGEPVTGIRNATSEDHLRGLLAAEGLFLSSSRVSRRGFGLSRGARPVRLSALLAFLREFRSLAGAGLPLTHTLALTEDRHDDPSLAAAIAGVRDEVTRGKNLADAMSGYPHVFDALTLATFRVGAETGNMDDALARLQAFLDLRHQLARNTRKAMTYPLFLLGLLAVTLAGLMLFVLPRFATLYAEFDSELPLATRILMAGVETAPIWVPTILGMALALWLVGRTVLASGPAARVFDRLKLRLPFFGPVLADIATIQVAHMMALLLRAGTPLPAALDHAASSLTNRYLAGQLRQAQANVTRGQSLSDASAGLDIFDRSALSLLKAGEASGELAPMFSAISAKQEQELDDRMARLLALIEPAMMLLVGIVLGTVIIAVYLPIFGLSSVVR